MTADSLACAIVDVIKARHPNADAHDIGIMAIALLVESLTFLVDRSTVDEKSRADSLRLVASVIEEAATGPRRAFPHD